MQSMSNIVAQARRAGVIASDASHNGFMVQFFQYEVSPNHYLVWDIRELMAIAEDNPDRCLVARVGTDVLYKSCKKSLENVDINYATGLTDADLERPLIATTLADDTLVIADGNHRLMRAWQLRRKNVYVRTIPHDLSEQARIPTQLVLLSRQPTPNGRVASELIGFASAARAVVRGTAPTMTADIIEAWRILKSSMPPGDSAVKRGLISQSVADTLDRLAGLLPPPSGLSDKPPASRSRRLRGADEGEAEIRRIEGGQL